MTEQEINRLAYQFNKQNYINMIVKKFKIDPEQARIDCKNWMDSYPQILSDLGVLVKAELDKTNDWSLQNNRNLQKMQRSDETKQSNCMQTDWLSWFSKRYPCLHG